MMPARTRTLIIGGGVGGLSAAHFLLQKSGSNPDPSHVLVLEKSDRLGGVLQTQERDGFLLEGGPDCFISEKSAGLHLVQDLSLLEDLIETRETFRKSFILKGSRLLPVPDGFYLMAPIAIGPFLRSPLISWGGKLRMLGDLWLPPRRSDTDESLADFVERRLGREALERIAQPMIGGIYTADPRKLSLQATMPQFLQMEREHKSVIRGLWALRRQKKAHAKNELQASGPRYGLFVSFRNGMETLTRTLAEKIPPSCLHPHTTAIRLHRNSNQTFTVDLATGEQLHADRVCLALPAHAAASLLHSTASDLAEELQDIPYASSATVNFAFRREQIAHPLHGMGFVVPAIENRSLVGVSFSSQKFSHRAPEGHVLLRAFLGGQDQENLLARDEKDVLGVVERDLRDILGISGVPVFTSLTRWEKSMAQYYVGHQDRVARIHSKLANLPGLQLVGNGLEGVGIPDVIRSAYEAVEALSNPS